MVSKTSAGILLYRRAPSGLEVLLVHPGGPFFAPKDAGAWSIPKGEIEDHDPDKLAAALREFQEETGFTAERSACVPLAPVRLKSGKTVFAWAVEGDADPDALRSNLFEMEYPPKSGRMARFPEVDRAGWFPVATTARVKVNPGLLPLLDQIMWNAR